MAVWLVDLKVSSRVVSRVAMTVVCLVEMTVAPRIFMVNCIFKFSFLKRIMRNNRGHQIKTWVEIEEYIHI
jgi:hypothetical protein